MPSAGLSGMRPDMHMHTIELYSTIQAKHLDTGHWTLDMTTGYSK